MSAQATAETSLIVGDILYKNARYRECAKESAKECAKECAKRREDMKSLVGTPTNPRFALVFRERFSKLDES